MTTVIMVMLMTHALDLGLQSLNGLADKVPFLIICQLHERVVPDLPACSLSPL